MGKINVDANLPSNAYYVSAELHRGGTCAAPGPAIDGISGAPTSAQLSFDAAPGSYVVITRTLALNGETTQACAQVTLPEVKAPRPTRREVKSWFQPEMPVIEPKLSRGRCEVADWFK